jgi:hypothetical protein
MATLRKPVGRNGLAAVPNPAAQNEAEETRTQFKEHPLGRNNHQGS